MSEEPKEVAIKVRYTIEFEKQFTYPTGENEPNEDIENRIRRDIKHDKDEFIDSSYYRNIDYINIEDREI